MQSGRGLYDSDSKQARRKHCLNGLKYVDPLNSPTQPAHTHSQERLNSNASCPPTLTERPNPTCRYTISLLISGLSVMLGHTSDPAQISHLQFGWKGMSLIGTTYSFCWDLYVGWGGGGGVGWWGWWGGG